MLPNALNISNRAPVEIFQGADKFCQECVCPFTDTIRAVIDERNSHRRSPTGIM
jgi:hypothetical protein